jgi:ferredoxin
MNDMNIENNGRGEDTSKQEGEMTRRELLKKASPLGRVSMIDRTCTACGLCAAECEAGALSIEYDKNEGICRLLFRHHLCIACGRCVKICPEQCLKVERTLDTGSLNGPAEVLIEDEVVACAKCGVPFASRSMVHSIRAKLGIKDEAEGAYLEICPGCKDGIHLTGAER